MVTSSGVRCHPKASFVVCLLTDKFCVQLGISKACVGMEYCDSAIIAHVTFY